MHQKESRSIPLQIHKDEQCKHIWLSQWNANWSQSDFPKSTIATDDRREGDPVQESTPRKNAKQFGSLTSGGPEAHVPSTAAETWRVFNQIQLFKSTITTNNATREEEENKMCSKKLYQKMRLRYSAHSHPKDSEWAGCAKTEGPASPLLQCNLDLS